jgi:ketosteroid isomerase-like protein
MLVRVIFLHDNSERFITTRRQGRTAMTFRARSCFAFFVLFLLLTSAGVVRAGSEDEVKALFARFVAAQNAHDLKDVGALLQDSAQFLWITRGALIWGHDAAIKRFEALYQGTWFLDPKMDELKVIELQTGVAQLYVPVIFMISPSGQTAQPARFLMNQVLVKTRDGWKITSILPIPAPQP